MNSAAATASNLSPTTDGAGCFLILTARPSLREISPPPAARPCLLAGLLPAADCVTTSVPAVGGNAPFYGTSCATPHAGALAALALVLQSRISTASQVAVACCAREGAVEISKAGPGFRRCAERRHPARSQYPRRRAGRESEALAGTLLHRPIHRTVSAPGEIPRCHKAPAMQR